MNKKDERTIQAPTQYVALEYWALKTICPIKDSGMVMDIPTVTTNGVVTSNTNATTTSSANVSSTTTPGAAHSPLTQQQAV